MPLRAPGREVALGRGYPVSLVPPARHMERTSEIYSKPQAQPSLLPHHDSGMPRHGVTASMATNYGYAPPGCTRTNSLLSLHPNCQCRAPHDQPYSAYASRPHVFKVAYRSPCCDWADTPIPTADPLVMSLLSLTSRPDIVQTLAAVSRWHSMMGGL
ncbi:uncharacterized protein B0I36DRAFT_139197 [Microdochium trichocladiopsis]|uniref:Uncharacterized protein n=1 Tax=Microdochium trichocladiopsis TaxID=1682393 RepID=A0A9P8Y3Y8_9PEZI|nr:uncharacterized protein B0I36DRAFT_139197 [Microdochium trichocladiopsis]KAH7027492.1 hypothetical protein B0I36DRAFT_139197 [Microdochium trichocladiopsis]